MLLGTMQCYLCLLRTYTSSMCFTTVRYFFWPFFSLVFFVLYLSGFFFNWKRFCSNSLGCYQGCVSPSHYFGVCIAPAYTPSTCVSQQGQMVNGTCVLPLVGISNCTSALGRTWINCPATQAQCESGPYQQILQCSAQIYTCSNKTTCEQTGTIFF
jgi:hypothetical protein